MRRRTLIIKCNQCNKVLFRYAKIGKGHLIRCWKNRIFDSCLIEKQHQYYCPCGCFVGTDQQVWIKLKKQHISILK